MDEIIIKYVFRLRIPAISLEWLYEVASSSENAEKQLSAEFPGFDLSAPGLWETEVCTLDDIAFLCKDRREMFRKLNKKFGVDGCGEECGEIFSG